MTETVQAPNDGGSPLSQTPTPGIAVVEPAAPAVVGTPAVDTGKPASAEAAKQPAVATGEATEAEKTLLNKDEGKKAEGAPEKYADFTVPEGSTLDTAVAKEAGELFKGLNLSQDSAQKLVDFYSAKSKESAEAPMKAWKDTQEKWISEVKADPEIGGKLDLVKTTVNKALSGLPPDMVKDFKAAMDYTGAGNNPAFIRTLYRLASMVTEGSHVAGRGPVEVSNPSGKRPSAAEALFPNLSQG
jgi:hypothetical protein